MPQPGQPSASQGFDLQKILALMNAQKQMQQQQLFPQAQASQGPNLASLLAQFSNSGAQQSAPQQFNYNQQQRPYHDEEKKRGFGNQDGYSDNYSKRPRVNGDSKSRKHVSHCSNF